MGSQFADGGSIPASSACAGHEKVKMTLMAWLRWSLFGWLGLVGMLALATGCGDDDGDDSVDMAVEMDLGGTDAFMNEPDASAETDAFTAEPDASSADGGAGSALDNFETDVATAKCAALFRCCDSDSREQFFGQYECFPGLPCPYEDEQDMIPPADMGACVTLMQALDEVTFGTWLTETRAGRIDFDEASHQSCLDTLDTAACGDALSDALDDASCFARISSLPPGAAYAVEHGSFDRTAGVGDDCVTLFEDPYGSCDPELAFCCVGGAGSCTTGGPGGEAGSCVAISATGEACTQFPDQHCEPGLRCPPPASIGDTPECEEPPTLAALAVGDECVSATFETLGECTDSYCDSDTRLCTATRANGEDCNAGEQCTSGNCEVMGTPPIVSRECADPTFCIGS